MYREGARMSQNFDVFVPSLKHSKLLACAEEAALANEKAKDEQDLEQEKQKLDSYFQDNRWWYIDNKKMILDTYTRILWDNILYEETHRISHEDATNSVNDYFKYELDQWKLPSKQQLSLVTQANFPLREGNNYRLFNEEYWHVSDNGGHIISLDVVDSQFYTGTARIIAINEYLSKNKSESILDLLLERRWSFQVISEDELLSKNLKNTLKKINYLESKNYNYKPQVRLSEVWQNLDYLTTRLPKIDALRFSDVDQGMWEFYVPEALKNKYQKISSEQFYRERNPALDIQHANVAIDFGTSSTVVAIRQNGRDELLRIGMQAKDFHKDELTDQQYENPTILEFTDLQNFLKDWKSEAYRPLVNWDNIHCAHEARASLRNNDSNSHVVSSIFVRLKQWALRDEKQAQVRIRDQQNYEYQLDALVELNPVKGQPIELNNNYPEIDPIEIYAWFLGMNINWRARGIFLNYYLTFPVEYPNEVKAKILASFRRGLQRSLPESLIYDERFNEFSVEELASEPAAFAAAALQRLEIEPIDGGVSYAVFDFGGGTTDFDYGFYRTPTEDEYDEGWDHVIEHFGSSGDKFLGGENLLENLAYLVFQANSSECRKKNISFTKPLDATTFAGSELLIAQTQAAYTNTTLMMSKLRPLWEKGKLDLNSEGLEQFKLIDKNGELVDCNIEIKQVDLIAFLEQRIQSGLKEFFIALRKAFMEHAKKMPEVVHILLAGNSSRSHIVLGLLGRLEDERSQVLHELLLTELAEIFDDEFPELEIHLPLDADPTNPYAATAKTGVALGLLHLCPGETLKVVNHATLANTDSPFQYFVGAFRRDQFQTAIQRGQNYDEWIEIGRPLNGVFVMGYTTSSKAAIANSLKRGEIVLSERSIRLSGNTQGHKVFAKVISPNQIEVCTAISLSELHDGISNNIQVIDCK